MAVALKPHEAFRIQVILRDTQKKLQFLGRVMQNLKSKGQDDVTEMMGDEISRIISEQRSLEQKYAGLVKQRESLTGIANKQRYLEVKQEIKEIANALRDNTKHLTRVLKDNPNLQDNLVKIEKDRQGLMRNLEECISELFVPHFQNFSYKITDELHAHDLLAKKKQQEKETSQNAKQLQEDYEKEKQEYTTESKEAHIEIERRRDELKEAKRYQTIRVKYEEKESQASIAAEIRSFQDREKSKLDKIERLRKKKEMEEAVHQRFTQYYEEKVANIQVESEMWKKKREDDTQDLRVNIDHMNQKKEKAKKYLEDLNEEIEQEKKRQMEREKEEREREEKLKKEREDNERKTLACEIIAREFMKYKEVAAKFKGKKKRGGKKKK